MPERTLAEVMRDDRYVEGGSFLCDSTMVTPATTNRALNDREFLFVKEYEDGSVYIAVLDRDGYTKRHGAVTLVAMEHE